METYNFITYTDIKSVIKDAITSTANKITKTDLIAQIGYNLFGIFQYENEPYTAIKKQTIESRVTVVFDKMYIQYDIHYKNDKYHVSDGIKNQYPTLRVDYNE